MVRSIAALALAFAALSLSACSLVFAPGPPRGFQHMNAFECQESRVAPTLDLTVGVVAALGTMMNNSTALAPTPSAWDNAQSITFSVAYLASATKGFVSVDKCRKAHAALRARLAHDSLSHTAKPRSLH